MGGGDSNPILGPTAAVFLGILYTPDLKLLRCINSLSKYNGGIAQRINLFAKNKGIMSEPFLLANKVGGE